MLDRKVAPPFSKKYSLQLPNPDTRLLSSGVPLHVVGGVQQDVSKLEVIFPAGKWYDTITGASQFTSQMLEKGTSQRTSVQVAEHFDRYGAHVEILPGNDFSSIALYSLNHNLEKVLPLFLEILKAPTFPESELKQMKEIFIQNLKINKEKTSFLASRAIRKNILGSDHPSGSSVEEKDALHLAPVDLIHFHKNFFYPVEIFLVSNGHPKLVDQVMQEVDGLSRKNPAKNYSGKSISPYAEKIEKQNTVQASIRLGKRTVSRTHPDYFDLLLLNHVLGGYFGSRLMKNIREEKGLTYGIYSSISSMVHAGLLVIGADVNKENTDLTLTEIKNELHQLQTVRVEADELESAKGHFIGSLQAEIANPFAVADKLKTLKLFSLPETHYQDMISRVSMTSSEDLLKLAKVHLDPVGFFQVVAG